MSCEKSMRTHVVITVFALGREDNRNINRYVSKLEYERLCRWNALCCCATCNIFISFINLSSHSVLCRLTLCLFKSWNSLVAFWSALVPASCLRSTESTKSGKQDQLRYVWKFILFQSMMGLKSRTGRTFNHMQYILITCNIFFLMIQP